MRVYSLKSVLPALLIAGACAFYTGRGVHNQAKVNFDSAEILATAEAEVPEKPEVPPDKLKPIEIELSEYNRRILNARLLSLYTIEEREEVTDPYLESLVGSVKHLANVPLAGRTAGKIVAIAVGIISTILYFNVAWLIINALRLLMEKQFKQT